jgi:CheY-like chemotaxis protein
MGLRPMLERLIGEHIELRFDFDRGLSTINGDTGQLEQVVMNLVLNARDAMREGGALRIETRNRELGEEHGQIPQIPAGRYAVLVVADTGHGMDAHAKNHLFEPFFTTKPFGEGTGLGLPTVYGIVKQFGGFIVVESEVGRGTTFTVYWPAAAQHPSPGGVATPRREAPIVVGRETILLVEDEEPVRRFVKLALERSGFRVLEAASPRTAMAVAAAEGPVHLLLTDVVMPGQSGADLAAELRRVYADLPVLYISGYPASLITANGMLANVSAPLLMKPFTSQELLANVESALGRAGTRT